LISLKKKADEFLAEYDEDKSGKIDLTELEEKRKELAEDLNKEQEKEGTSQLGGIIEEIQNLEKEIIKYRQAFYYGISKEDKKNEADRELASQLLETDTPIPSGSREQFRQTKTKKKIFHSQLTICSICSKLSNL
jgi:hypothetical protein